MSRHLKEVRGLARGRVFQAKREARANALRWAVPLLCWRSDKAAGVTGAGPAEGSRRNESGRSDWALWAPQDSASLCWDGSCFKQGSGKT